MSNEDFIARYLDWLDTPEGKAAATDAASNGDDTRALFERCKDIDLHSLYEPFTI